MLKEGFWVMDGVSGYGVKLSEQMDGKPQSAAGFLDAVPSVEQRQPENSLSL